VLLLAPAQFSLPSERRLTVAALSAGIANWLA